MRRTSKFHPDNAVPFSHDISLPWVQRDGTRTHVDVLMLGVVDDTDEELRDAVREVLDSCLTPLERAVVECAVDGGMSLSQTAAALGLKAKSYVHRVRVRAFAKLRAELANNPIIQERYEFEPVGLPTGRASGLPDADV